MPEQTAKIRKIPRVAKGSGNVRISTGKSATQAAGKRHSAMGDWQVYPILLNKKGMPGPSKDRDQRHCNCSLHACYFCGGISWLHCAPVLPRPVRSFRILCRSINSLKPVWCSSTMALKASIFWVQSWWVNRFGAWGFSSGLHWLQEVKEPQVPRRPSKLKPWLSSSSSSWVVIEAADALPIELKEGSSKKMSSILRVLRTFPILQESGPFIVESGAFAAPSHSEKQTKVFIIEKDLRQASPRHHSEMLRVTWLFSL